MKMETNTKHQAYDIFKFNLALVLMQTIQSLKMKMQVYMSITIMSYNNFLLFF